MKKNAKVGDTVWVLRMDKVFPHETKIDDYFPASKLFVTTEGDGFPQDKLYPSRRSAFNAKISQMEKGLETFRSWQKELQKKIQIMRKARNAK